MRVLIDAETNVLRLDESLTSRDLNKIDEK